MIIVLQDHVYPKIWFIHNSDYNHFLISKSVLRKQVYKYEFIFNMNL